MRLWCLQIVDDCAVPIKIGNSNTARSRRVRSMRVPASRAAVAGPEPRLDDVGVRNLSRFSNFWLMSRSAAWRCTLRGRIFSLGNNQPVVSLGHRNHQSAGRNFGFGSGLRQRRGRAPVVRNVGERQGFMNLRLADVLVDSVIGNKFRRVLNGGARPGRRDVSIGLGINILIVINSLREECRTSQRAIQCGCPTIESCPVFGIIRRAR